MTLLQMSVQAGVLIAVIVIIRSIAINKLPKLWFLVMWFVALMRLLIPFSFASKWSAYNLCVKILSNTGTSYDSTGNEVMANIGELIIQSISCNDFQDFSMPLPIITMAWLIVMAVLILIFTFLCIKSHRELRFAIPFEGNLIIDEWLSVHKLCRKLRVCVSDRVTTPMAIGILHPRIILPKIMNVDNRQDLEYVLMHEYFHIRRFDALWKLLMISAACIHWFNPMVWIMMVLLNRDLEITCDELVIRHFGSSLNEKRAYAYSLISLAEMRGNYFSTRSYFSKNALEERICCIMKARKCSVFAFMLALVLVVGTITLFTTTASASNGQASIENSYLGNSEIGKLVLPLEGLIIKGNLADIEEYANADTDQEREEILELLISDPDNTVTQIDKAEAPSKGGQSEADLIGKVG